MRKKKIKFEQLSIDFVIEKENKSQPVEEPIQSAEEPIQSAEEPIQPVEEPIQPVEEPIQPVEEPIQPVEEPIQPVEIKEPTFTNKNSFKAIVVKKDKEQKELEKAELAQKDKNFPYKRNTLMTNAEKQLFHFMKNNLYLKERVLIFPKVRLGDLVELDSRLSKDTKNYYKVACKHVDYVIVDKDELDIICVVELDDYTHENEEAKKRDEFVFFTLQSVDIKLERIKTKIADISKADLFNIETHIANRYKPNCYRCGCSTHIATTNKFGKRHRFYSCDNYTECRWTLDCD